MMILIAKCTHFRRMSKSAHKDTNTYEPALLYMTVALQFVVYKSRRSLVRTADFHFHQRKRRSSLSVRDCYKSPYVNQLHRLFHKAAHAKFLENGIQDDNAVNRRYCGITISYTSSKLTAGCIECTTFAQAGNTQILVLGLMASISIRMLIPWQCEFGIVLRLDGPSINWLDANPCTCTPTWIRSIWRCVNHHPLAGWWIGHESTPNKSYTNQKTRFLSQKSLRTTLNPTKPSLPPCNEHIPNHSTVNIAANSHRQALGVKFETGLFFTGTTSTQSSKVYISSSLAS
jgi:hypothetical protein